LLLVLPDLLYGKLKTKRGKLTMLKSVCVFFSVLFIAPLATAEIFKCVGKKGEALYQNFPCQFESMGGIPMDAAGSKTSTADVRDPKKSPTDVAGPKKSPAAPAEPRIGMTTEEVRAIWGEPTDTHWEEPGDGDLSELWSYGASRSVRFDRKRRVAAIQQ
jgi:hypothetical protein